MGAGGAAGGEEPGVETAPWGRGCAAPSPRPGSRRGLGCSAAPRASPVLLGGPGGSGRDGQPGRPQRPGSPGLRHPPRRRAAALRSRPALRGVRSPAGPPAGGGARAEPAERLRAALGSRMLRATAGPGGREQARKAKLPVSPGREGHPPPSPGSADRDSGRLRDLGNHFPGCPPIPRLLPHEPQSRGTPSGPPARVRPSAVLPMALFASQGDFAATFWLSEALRACPPKMLQQKSLAMTSLGSFLGLRLEPG